MLNLKFYFAYIRVNKENLVTKHSVNNLYLRSKHCVLYFFYFTTAKPFILLLHSNKTLIFRSNGFNISEAFLKVIKCDNFDIYKQRFEPRTSTTFTTTTISIQQHNIKLHIVTYIYYHLHIYVIYNI